MTVTRPHPLRRAYLLDRRNFLAAHLNKAARLFEYGYGASETETPHLFRLHRGDGEGLRTHLVDPVAGCCTCPFHRRQVEVEPLTTDGAVLPCKHILGLGKLVEETLKALRAESDHRRYFPLSAHWIATRQELRRRHSRLLELWPTPDERRRPCQSPSTTCDSAR
jgi:hypothetical protein